MLNRGCSSSGDDSDESLGHEIVRAASSPSRLRASASTLKASTSTLKASASTRRVSFRDTESSGSDESRVLREMEDFLDEALGEPSPKRSRDSSSASSDSFEYSDKSDVQLVHTVSVYRKQQSLQQVKPVTVVKREPEPKEAEEESDEEEEVARKIHDLLIEVSKQQTIIAQTSQALNLCLSTLEFSGSTEQIEGERLLLIATNRRQACLHELQRLRVEKSLRSGGGPSRGVERGDLVIESIILPVKTDAIRFAARDENCHYVMCLARCGDTVLSTEMIPALPKNAINGMLNFVKPLHFESLHGDFALTVEVYSLVARSKELLPHDVKYHISGKRDKRSTPKKVQRRVESLGGPNTVRSPMFRINGFVVFSLRDLARTNFTLNKVPYESVVEGSARLRVWCDMKLDSEHRGFLTMFEDVSGIGAWDRRWCLLRGDKISYWKYPEDERTKVALDTVDLTQSTTREVAAVARDVCARPNTFQLEIRRPHRPGDLETLITKTDGNMTTIRYLLSADTKEERSEWCRLLTKTLALLRAWRKN